MNGARGDIVLLIEGTPNHALRSLMDFASRPLCDPTLAPYLSSRKGCKLIALSDNLMTNNI